MMTIPTIPTFTGSRDAALRRARFLNAFSISYNVAEAAIAITAGVIAGSVGLLGFGLDSAVEVSASLILLWRLRQERRGGCMSGYDHRATRMIAVSFAALAMYVTYESLGQLLAWEGPEVSHAGIGLATVSVIIMPVLATMKARLAVPLGSQAVSSEARQTMICAYLSGVLLVGLGMNAVAGWWWGDPLAALVIAGVAGREALMTWRAESLEDTCCA